MTCEPAVTLRSSGLVAFDAKAHFKLNGREAIHLLYLTVTRGAINLFPDVRLVLELDVVRDIVDSHPRYGSLRIVVPPHLTNLRVPGDDVTVTKKTFAHSRDPCILGSFREGMAELTADSLHPRVNAMAEVDGLLRSNNLMRIEIVQVKHDND
jgi:hypothetical protein